MKHIVDLITGKLDDCRIRMETAVEAIKAEDELACLAGADFVCAIKPVLRELSAMTGKAYTDYLEDAKNMLLERSCVCDVLYHYDMMLRHKEENNG